ncbi:amino acid or gaba permease [Hyaloraphidium curvatum]|nr:amino acid or gaba permease [Hyaloraphidium curvatum]
MASNSPVAAADANVSVNLAPVAQTVDKDELQLAKLGYKQEFHRGLGVFENFAASFSTIAFVLGLPSLFGFAMYTGGPLAAWVNWIIIGFCALSTALVLAEICSAYPTAGGIYFWSAKLGGERWGPFLSWLTAWWSWAGWVVTWPAVCHTNSTMLISGILVKYPEYTNPLWVLFIMDVVQVFLTTLMNIVDEEFMKWFYRISSTFMLGVYILFFTWLPAKVPKWQSGSIMTQFVDGTGATQYFGNEQGAKAYVWFVSLLFPAWTFYGYDASAHIAEETKGAARTASRGMYTSVAMAFVFSFAMLLILLFAIQDGIDPDTGAVIPGVDLIAAGYAIYPQPIVVLFESTVGPDGALAFMVLIFIVGFNCAAACGMSASRVTYAISRDGILPFSHYWHHMSPKKMPVRAQWLCAALSVLILLPVLGSTVAFTALSSTGTISVDTSYLIPILGRLTAGRHTFKQGEWNLGRFSVPLGIFVCIWISVLFVCLCLPQLWPVTASTFNFAPVMIGGISLISGLGWIFSGRKWFKGPQRLISEAEAEAMENAYSSTHGGAHMPHDKLEYDSYAMEGVGSKA